MAVDFKKMREELPEGTEFNIPIFEGYMIPNGFLGTAVEEHALFFYYINARQTYELFVIDTPILMETDADPEFSFRDLLTSIAALYGCDPEKMVKAWDTVDRQCDKLDIPRLPDEYQYRFANSKSIIIQ